MEKLDQETLSFLGIKFANLISRKKSNPKPNFTFINNAFYNAVETGRIENYRKTSKLLK